MEDIENRVKSIVSEQLGVKLEDIKNESKFRSFFLFHPGLKANER